LLEIRLKESPVCQTARVLSRAVEPRRRRSCPFAINLIVIFVVLFYECSIFSGYLDVVPFRLFYYSHNLLNVSIIVACI
jgi:hypothetical protein